jgi:CDP-glucose 4,6-dehydratase
MGTAHVLEACRATPSVRAIVVVTTDKCYRNAETQRPYVEDDPLGGHDPYSASKAATEILVESYRRSFFYGHRAALLASARAGNVIGGGDWSTDRLVPDVVRAARSGEPMKVRSPRAVRPWQHVLDSLSGYLYLGQRLLQEDSQAAAAWNFGPRLEDTCTVAELLDRLQAHWPAARWQDAAPGARPHEAGLLRLDIGKAQRELGWQPVWGLDEAVAQTARWYRAHAEHGAVHSREQLAQYEVDARQQEVAWAAA